MGEKRFQFQGLFVALVLFVLGMALHFFSVGDKWARPVK
mgnify:CR=1 FL=1